jgi:hypothetical protein
MLSFPCLFSISTVASAAKEAEVKEITENNAVTRMDILFIVLIMVNITFFTYGLINYYYPYNW